MKTRVELKTLAKEQIKGNIGMLFVCGLIMGLISGVASGITVRFQGSAVASLIPTLITFLVTPSLTMGMTYIFLGLTNGEAVKVERLFDGFKNYKNVTLMFLLQTIFITLWSLLLVVPGIIKSFSYAMSFYILAENPEMGPKEVLDESKRMMDGHKMDLFVLGLSFIPWILLICVTCGIAAIYVGPYMQATTTNFYLDLKNNDSNPTVVESTEE